MKLNKIKQLNGVIILQTGLHIGAGNDEMHIGGIDAQVVKHPQTSRPYIPGSSIKGKMRSLLELYLGLINVTDGKVFQSKFLKDLAEKDKADAIALLKLFGDSADNEKNDLFIGSTRLSFSDCFVNKKTEGYVLSEVKSENSINRKTSESENLWVRERVPQGVEFDFTVSIKEFDKDESSLINLDLLKTGLKLLELDALGGSGSRGYGRIKFDDLKLDGQPFIVPELS